ncbi:MAG: shikimate dehydrogenase [Bacteroidetes bacterium]|jgi:shikimate dehydrogenase|nr:shikimate dehydrogenase [Bacteroidota bacterium]
MTFRFAIIGDPIAHSLSPVLHAAAFAALGIDATYECLRVRREELQDTWERRLRSEFSGFNVTLPHKSAVLPLLDQVEALAASVGAVNTVSNRDGRLEGTNTDIQGIRRALETSVGDVRGRPVAIIGAGGTARSAVAALAADLTPSHLTFLVRDPERANEHLSLARRSLACPVEVTRLNDPNLGRVLSEAALIIQTTPVGMEPGTGRSPLPAAFRFTPTQTVFDVIYRPLETAMMAAARQDGARVIGGLEFFLHQGAAAFEIWTGRPMPLEVVRPAIVRALGA